MGLNPIAAAAVMPDEKRVQLLVSSEEFEHVAIRSRTDGEVEAVMARTLPEPDALVDLFDDRELKSLVLAGAAD